MYQEERETSVRIPYICHFIDEMKKNSIIRKILLTNVTYHTGNPDSIPAIGNISKAIGNYTLFDILWKGGRL